MATLTVTARGQVTVRKEILQHLDIRPGEKTVLDLLPDGRAEPRKGSWADVIGVSEGKTDGARLSIEEIDGSIAEAGAAAGLALLDAGGNFADGVIAHESRWLGGGTSVILDRSAVRLVESSGHEARLLR